MRNKHGAHLVYEYTPQALETYSSPMPGHKFFPDILVSHAKCTEFPSDEYRSADIRSLRKGARIVLGENAIWSLRSIWVDCILRKAEEKSFEPKQCSFFAGRLPNTRDSYYFPGFPSLRFLPHRAELTLQGCTIFQQASRGYNMILHLEDRPDDVETYVKLIGKEIHINYPHLKQAIVSKVCSKNTITTTNGTTKMSEMEVSRKFGFHSRENYLEPREI